MTTMNTETSDVENDGLKNIIQNYEKLLAHKNREIDVLKEKLKDLRLQKDKQLEALKETIEKVINDKDKEIRHLRAIASPETKQGVIPGLGNDFASAKARFGISSEKFGTKKVLSPQQTLKTELQKANIRRAFKKNIFLSKLGRLQIEELINFMQKEQNEAGETIIKEGENGDKLYVVEKGQVDVIKAGENTTLATLPTGCVFGELAILYNSKRTASVLAKTDVTLWTVDRDNFKSIVQLSGEKIRQEYVKILHTVEHLKELSDEEIVRVADCLEEESFKAGEYIIRQGEVGDTFYIINEGKVKITKSVKDNETKTEQLLTYMTKGTVFGERALLRDDRRAANVIAFTDVICLTMDRQAFNSLIRKIPNIGILEEDVEIISLPPTPGSNTNDEESDRFMRDKNIILFTPLKEIKILKLVGKGGFGSVSLVSIAGVSDRSLALKKINKSYVSKMGQEQHILNERKLLFEMDSPFVCRLFRTYKDRYNVYMLMEAYLGGDVYFHLKKERGFSDECARFVIGCVVEALGYIHGCDIAYRDLKPENLMLDQNGYIKLIDFGFAKKMDRGAKTYTFCGTPEYFPPEILQNLGHDHSADYWSLGVLVFELLAGTTPFFAPEDMLVYEKIVDGIEMVKFPECISRNAELLVRNLCKLDAKERLGNTLGGINEIRKHRWFRGFHWEGLRRLMLISPFDINITKSDDARYFETPLADLAGYDEEQIDTEGWDEEF